MNIIEVVEKCINEHGSSAILRERVGLAKAQYEALERKANNLESENAHLHAQNKELREQIRVLEDQVGAIHADNPSGYRCDHCGSQALTRTGSRPDPMFGELGAKVAVFCCAACGKESAFAQSLY